MVNLYDRDSSLNGRSVTFERAEAGGRREAEGETERKVANSKARNAPDVSTSGWILGDKLAVGVARPADKKGPVVELR